MTPKEIYKKMKIDYNSRCRNKFLRIEIGVAPKDEKRLSPFDLMKISYLFAKQMGFDNHQVAVTRKDTDVHIIANRINLCMDVGKTGDVRQV